MAEEAAEEKIEFGNHVIQLFEKLRKIPNSAKEVFLWDLIRHSASSLCDYRLSCLRKRRIEYTEEENSTFVIRVDADKDDNTLSITHKGVGLTKHELKDVLGCVSADIVDNFFDTIDEYLMNGDPNAYYSALLGEDSSLGLYSAFMVADRVVITTTSKLKKEHVPAIDWDAKPIVQYVWDASASDGFFRLTRVDLKAKDRLMMTRGSKITLYLKNEYLTYLDKSKLRELVDKYTLDACPYPIYVSSADDHERENKRRHITGNREEELESLKKDFEGLRELCVIALESIGSQVELVVVDDRIFDLPAHVSNNCKTFVINPRSHKLKSLLEYYNENPDSLKKKKMVMGTFIIYSRIFSATLLSPLPLRPPPPPPPETYLSKLGRYVDDDVGDDDDDDDDSSDDENEDDDDDDDDGEDAEDEDNEDESIDDENENERTRKRKRKRKSTRTKRMRMRMTMRMSIRIMTEGSRRKSHALRGAV